ACLPAPEQTCVLLARVDAEIIDGTSGIGVRTAVVDDRERPILVSTRVLQEALFAVGADEVVPRHRHALAQLEDVDPTVPPAAGDTLRFDGTRWLAAPAQVTDHGSLTGLADDDHPQYLLVDGGRALTGDLSAGGHRLSGLPPSAMAGQPIVQAQAAGGDLRDSYPDPTIDRIQGVPVDAAAPDERDAFVLHDGRWRPLLPWILPLATIQPFTVDRFYVVWFNLDAP